MFKIGEFSKLTNLTIKALRHYETMGILIPEKIDPTTSYRYYSASQLETVNKLKMLQEIGFPLKTIKTILQSNDSTILENNYQLRESAIQQELKELKNKQTLLNRYQEKIKNNHDTKEYKVEIKQIPKRKVMSLRKVIPSYAHEHDLWHSLHDEFIRQHVKMATPPLAVTIYHDTEYKETDVDIEVQSSIIGEYDNKNDVLFYETSELTMASVTFNGSFEQMPEITQAIASWIEVNRYVVSGPMVNISYVSPAQERNPEKWVTTSGYIVKK